VIRWGAQIMVVDRDVAGRASAFVRADNPKNAGEQPATTDSRAGQSLRKFPVERFEDLETWIVARSAAVRRAIAAECA